MCIYLQKVSPPWAKLDKAKADDWHTSDVGDCNWKSFSWRVVNKDIISMWKRCSIEAVSTLSALLLTLSFHIPSTSPFLYRLKLIHCSLFTQKVKKIKGAAHKNGNVDSKCKRSFTLLSPKNINFFANDFPFRHPKYSNNGSHCSPAAVWLVAELRLVRPTFFCTFGNLRRYFLQPNNTAPVSAKHYYKTIVFTWLESSKMYGVHPLY